MLPLLSIKTRVSPGRNGLALQFHPEVTAWGLERWFIGHACRNNAWGQRQLRQEAAHYIERLEAQAAKFWHAWLEKLEKEASSKHAALATVKLRKLLSQLSNRRTLVSISQIAGYTYGTSVISPSPISQENFDTSNKLCYSLKRTSSICGWQGQFCRSRRTILDLWYNFVGSHPYLIQYSGKPKQPDSAYLGAVRQRFKQWIDTCNRV